MPLNLTVDTLDSVPEPQRELYVQRDGKYHLDVEGVEDTSGLKSALEKERKAAREASAQAQAWKSLGKSPDEIQALLEAQAKADEDKATKAGEWDKLRAQMNERHEAAIKAEQDKAGKMRGALERYLIDAQATAAIAAAKGVPALLLPHVQRQVRVVEEDGEFVARVVDAKGDPRVDAKGAPLTVDALIAEMKADEIYGRAFEASGAGGSGAKQSTGGAGKVLSLADFNKLSSKERAAHMASGGTIAE